MANLALALLVSNAISVGFGWMNLICSVTSVLLLFYRHFLSSFDSISLKEAFLI